MADNDKLGRLHDAAIEQSTGPRAPEPVIHTTAIKGDGEDEVRVAREKFKEIMDEAAKEVEETAREWGSAPRPNRDGLTRRLSEVRETYQAKVKEIGHPTYKLLDKKWVSTLDELPDYSESEDPAAEKEYREFFRSLEGDGRLATIREKVEKSETARRAVFNDAFDAEMAGLPSEDYREQLREQVLRQEAPEAVETVQALQKEISRFEEDLETADEFIRRVTQVPHVPGLDRD